MNAAIRQRVVGWGFALLCLTPWMWLVMLATFVAAASLAFGHFPSYSQPDPKHTGGLAILYTLSMGLLLAVFLSPLAMAAYALTRVKGDRRLLGAYAAGLVLSAAIVFGDAFGLMTWLLD